MPSSAVGLIDLREQVEKWQRNSGDKPIVIHCRYTHHYYCHYHHAYHHYCHYHHAYHHYCHHPSISHYSGGCGRTGTYIAICLLIDRLKTEGVVDVFQTVRALRLQRPGMVRSTVSTCNSLDSLLAMFVIYVCGTHVVLVALVFLRTRLFNK